jgi:hypothetical protein
MSLLRFCVGFVGIAAVHGCATYPNGTHLVTGASLLGSQTELQARVSALGADQSRYAPLLAAAREVGLIDDSVMAPGLLAFTAGIKVLPRELQQSIGVRKVVTVQLDAFMGRESGDSIEFTHDDLERLGSELARAAGLAPQTAGGAQARSYAASDRAATKFFDTAQQYYAAYFSGRFVDSRGTKYEKFKVSAEVGNDTITAFFSVLYEALLDSIVPPIVYYEDAAKTDVLNDSNERPTAAVIGLAIEDHAKPITDPGSPTQVTRLEAQAVQFLAQVAAEQSKLLSGLVVRLFGAAELSFVIGGHFSFGDNETLAKLSDAVFAGASHRAVSILADQLFRSDAGEGQHLADLLAILRKVYKAIGKT